MSDTGGSFLPVYFQHGLPEMPSVVKLESYNWLFDITSKVTPCVFSFEIMNVI